MNPFIPKGYVATEVAVKRYAEATNPVVWSDMPAIEREIWRQHLGTRLLKHLLDYIRSPVTSADDRSAAQCRHKQYMEAAAEMQQSLFAGEIKAWNLTKSNELEYIHSNTFAGGDEILVTLTIGIDIVPQDVASIYGSYRIFVNERELTAIIDRIRCVPTISQQDLKPANDEGATSLGRSRKVAIAFLREHPLIEPWPALEQHWLLVKMLPECRILSRNTFNLLRKQIAGDALPGRGRPRKIAKNKSPENKSPGN